MVDADVTSTVTAARLDLDLHEQWDALIDWLRSLDDDALAAPTPLPRWSVRDLVAHLALVMRVLARAEAADPDVSGESGEHGESGESGESSAPSAAGDVPRTLTFADYLASYAGTSSDIRERAIELAEHRDPIGSAESSGQAALLTLRELRDEGVRLVRVHRGVVALDTLVLTRLVELVVHADDLARSAAIPSPVDPTARTIVATALLSVLRSRTGYDLQVGDEVTWLRLATGRLPWSGRGRALRPGTLAEGLPDLSQALPLVR